MSSPNTTTKSDPTLEPAAKRPKTEEEEEKGQSPDSGLHPSRTQLAQELASEMMLSDDDNSDSDNEDESQTKKEMKEEPKMEQEEEGGGTDKEKEAKRDKNPHNLELVMPKPNSTTSSSVATPGTSGSLQMPSVARQTSDSGGLSTPAPDTPQVLEKTKEEQEEEERERMQVLVSNFTEDQLDRYEFYRRATFPKASIRRIMAIITGGTIGQNVVISMSGIARVFAGDVIETALDYKEEISDPGPLKPKHLREAARRLRERGHFPMPRTKKKCPFK